MLDRITARLCRRSLNAIAKNHEPYARYSRPSRFCDKTRSQSVILGSKNMLRPHTFIYGSTRAANCAGVAVTAVVWERPCRRADVTNMPIYVRVPPSEPLILDIGENVSLDFLDLENVQNFRCSPMLPPCPARPRSRCCSDRGEVGGLTELLQAIEAGPKLGSSATPAEKHANTECRTRKTLGSIDQVDYVSRESEKRCSAKRPSCLFKQISHLRTFMARSSEELGWTVKRNGAIERMCSVTQ